MRSVTYRLVKGREVFHVYPAAEGAGNGHGSRVRLLGSAAARIGQFDQVSGAAVEAYARLVRRSANTARRVDTANLLRRKHVRSVLDILLKANGPTSRSALLSQLALKEANLTRIVAPLLDLALVEREVNGREAAYRLTERGRVLVANRDTADYVDRLRVAQEFPLTRTCMVKPANSKSEGEAPNWTLQERQKVKTTVTKDAPYQSFANSRRHLVTEQRTVEA